jgi:hypothetical protein
MVGLGIAFFGFMIMTLYYQQNKILYLPHATAPYLTPATNPPGAPPPPTPTRRGHISSRNIPSSARFRGPAPAYLRIKCAILSILTGFRSPREPGLLFEEVWLTTSDNQRLQCWFIMQGIDML